MCFNLVLVSNNHACIIINSIVVIVIIIIIIIDFVDVENKIGDLTCLSKMNSGVRI